MEDRKPILVTGAAGQTGGHTVRQLLEKGHSVRALVHSRDKRADELASLGAEVVVGDFHDLGSLRVAMAGVNRAYFVHPWVARAPARSLCVWCSPLLTWPPLA